MDRRDVGLSRWPFAIAAAMAVGLLLLAGAYGFHRDELYFIVAGRHPDWGYIDQPPLTPLLSAAGATVFGVVPVAVRLGPALAVAACAVATAGIAREMGGGPRAQVVASLVLALSGILGAGHLGVTATYDILAWTVIAWLVARLLRGADPRLWLVVGTVAGIGLQNKHTVLLLGIGLVAGLLLDRRWDVFRSPWAWAAVIVAVLIWLPNLAWQAANGFPQFEMAARIAEDDERAMILPTQLLVAGLLLFPVALAGLWRLLRASEARPWRPLGWAYVAVLALLFVTSGRGYYAMGLLPALMAAGAIPLEGWLRAGRSTLRTWAFALAAAGSGLFTALVMLPILPPATMATTPIPDLYPETAEQVGWPALIAEVERIVGELPAGERDRAVIVTGNYGEAAALTLLGADLPPVHSGHNSFADWGPPPDGLDLVITVGYWEPQRWPDMLGACEPAGRVDNGLGVENEEQGGPIFVCRGRTVPWSAVWPSVRFVN